MLSTAVILQTEMNRQQDSSPPFKVPRPLPEQPHFPTTPSLSLPKDKPVLIEGPNQQVPEKKLDQIEPVLVTEEPVGQAPVLPEEKLVHHDRPPAKPDITKQVPVKQPVGQVPVPMKQPVPATEQVQGGRPVQPGDQQGDRQEAVHQGNDPPAVTVKQPNDIGVKSGGKNVSVGRSKDKANVGDTKSRVGEDRANVKGDDKPKVVEQLQEDMSQLHARLEHLEEENRDLKQRQEVIEQLQVDELLHQPEVLEVAGDKQAEPKVELHDVRLPQVNDAPHLEKGEVQDSHKKREGANDVPLKKEHDIHKNREAVPMEKEEVAKREVHPEEEGREEEHKRVKREGVKDVPVEGEVVHGSTHKRGGQREIIPSTEEEQNQKAGQRDLKALQ